MHFAPHSYWPFNCSPNGLPRWLSGKESTCQFRKHRFNPCVGKIPRRRKWQPTPVFLPGESHGQRSLVGYRPRGRKESDKTEWLHFHFSLVKSVKSVSRFILLHVDFQLSVPFIDKTFFLFCCLYFFVRDQLTESCGSSFGLTPCILFYWPVCLFFHQ